MSTVGQFLTRRAGGARINAKDVIVYGFLLLGVVAMLGPVLWGVMSSFKTRESILQFPPELLPREPELATVAGQDGPLPVFEVQLEDGTLRQMIEVRRVGLEGQYAATDDPDTVVSVPLDQARAVRDVAFAPNNYSDPLRQFSFLTYFRNSAFVTISATLVTLLINSMCAFALSKYRFRGRGTVFGLIISQLLIPSTVLLVPSFLVISWLGWFNSLNALIWPLVATPTGVFLLRQYMLTIPDEMLDSARIDGASEWRVYWEAVLPLSLPAIAVLAIFSVMWRWNDFIWPLVVISDPERYTLPLGLSLFSTEFATNWEQLLAMTVLSLLPITIIFAFLQRYITTGVASVGVKG